MVDLVLGADVGTTLAVKATTAASFSADVLNESSRQPVLVHFMSARSDACLKLQVALERAAKAASDKIKLVTMDVDAHPQIASRLGIRALPAVYAFQRGQPIDGFVGALPEAQIKGFVERLVGPLDDASDAILEEADALLTEGDAEGAAAAFSAVLEAEPDHLGAIGGLARALVALGDLDAARDLLSQAPTSNAKDKAIAAAQAALDVAEQASTLGELAQLLKKVEADPEDLQARFDLALGLNAKGRREEAAEALLFSIKKDRNWNEGAARKQLLQFFEAWGLMDSVTLSSRRKLSGLLFA